MRLSIGIDVITIATSIAVILVAGDYRAGDAAKDSASNCTGSSSNSWNNRTYGSAGYSTDDCAGRRTGNHVVSCRRCRTAAQ